MTIFQHYFQYHPIEADFAPACISHGMVYVSQSTSFESELESTE